MCVSRETVKEHLPAWPLSSTTSKNYATMQEEWRKTDRMSRITMLRSCSEQSFAENRDGCISMQGSNQLACTGLTCCQYICLAAVLNNMSCLRSCSCCSAKINHAAA
jgi:hypothetical protein